MKIIDFERKGNVVRFYIGEEDEGDYWGDDWRDIPYQDNAGRVYDRFIKRIVDIALPFDYEVLEMKDIEEDGFSKEDMKFRRIPCVMFVKQEDLEAMEKEYRGRIYALDYIQDPRVEKVYFEDYYDNLYFNEGRMLKDEKWEGESTND